MSLKIILIDVEQSIIHLIRDIKLNSSILSTVNENFKKLTRYDDLDNLSQTKSKLLADVENLIGQADGIIDHNSQVLRLFENQEEFVKFKEGWN